MPGRHLHLNVLARLPSHAAGMQPQRRQAGKSPHPGRATQELGAQPWQVETCRLKQAIFGEVPGAYGSVCTLLMSKDFGKCLTCLLVPVELCEASDGKGTRSESSGTVKLKDQFVWWPLSW